MPPVLSVSLALLSTLLVLGWLIVAVRVWRSVRGWPVVSEGRTLPAPPPGDDGRPARVSVIVPAHNEERVIDACCASLRAQTWPDLEIILVLDRCTDGTLEIVRRHAAEDARIRIVENDACPPDWAGKCNAARRGAEHATGTYLLFTDADTWFAPDLVASSVALAHARGLGLLSLLSTLTGKHWHERAAQPIASIMLIRLYPVERVNAATNPRPFANGQFMLFTRAAYEAVDGHAGVKDDLLEDIAFARAVATAGHRGGIFGADGMLRCSMYDSLAGFRAGWKRIFIEACKRKPSRLRKNALITGLAGVASPVVLAAAAVVGALQGDPFLVVIGALGFGVMTGCLAALYRLSGSRWWSIGWAPVGSLVVASAMLGGASDLVRRRPIRWAGKDYVLEPR